MIKHKVATGFGLKLIKWKGFYGWTSLWDTIYYRNEDCLNNPRLRKHELEHVAQMEREGKLMFMIKYIYFDLTIGYNDNPYEIEARKASERP